MPRRTAFRNVKTIAECLADELINAAKGSSNGRSNPICKDDEVEVDCDLFLRTASKVQELFRVKNKFHSKTNTTYSEINQVQINPKVPDHGLKCSGIRPEGVLTITKSLGIPRQIKVEHNVFGHSSGEGLVGSQKLSRSMLSAM